MTDIHKLSDEEVGAYIAEGDTPAEIGRALRTLDESLPDNARTLLDAALVLLLKKLPGIMSAGYAPDNELADAGKLLIIKGFVKLVVDGNAIVLKRTPKFFQTFGGGASDDESA